VRDVRGIESLWPHRQRRHVVVACVDDPAEYEAARPQLAELGAELVVECEPGRLSAAVGRPAVVVADRFGTVGLEGERPPLRDVLTQLEAFELSCPECGPIAWGDPGA